MIKHSLFADQEREAKLNELGDTLRVLRKHCQTPWVLLYVERWLKAPMQMPDGALVERTRGTPQGGVVSPLLANLFLHYAFDSWVGRHLPSVRFCRYADDGVIHCRSMAQAKFVLAKIGERFGQCGLELHPEKTRIVYCKDINRQGDFPCCAIHVSWLHFSTAQSDGQVWSRLRELRPRR